MIPRRTSDSRLNLSSNELSHPALESILSLAFTRLQCTDFRRYPNVSDAVDVIAEHLNLHPQEMLLTPGSDAAVRLICQHYVRSLTSTGRLLLQYPNYFAWEQSATLLGLKIERVRWSNIFAAGRELIEAARSHRGALIAISVPNGPVGGCMSAVELDELVETVRRQGHLLTIDSCYQAFNGEWTEHLRRHGEQVVVVQSLSKSHGLAGARLGILAGHENLVERLAKSHLEHAVSCAALSMGCAVLEFVADFEAIWNDIKCIRERAANALCGADLRVLPSGGNFLTFHVGSKERAAAAQRGMSAYGYRIKHLADDAALSDCLRMTIQDERTTQRALKRLFDVLDADLTLPLTSRAPLVEDGYLT